MINNLECVEHKQLFEKSPLLMIITDLTGNIAEANTKALEKLGYDKEEICNKNYLDVTDQYYVVTAQHCLSRFKESDCKFYSVEHKFRTKSGNELWGEVEAILIREIDENNKLILLQISDVTEYKQAINELQQEEVKYLTLIENSEDCILRLDVNGNVLYANQAATEVYGIKYNEITQMNIKDINDHIGVSESLDEGMFLAKSGFTHHFSDVEYHNTKKIQYYAINLIPEKNEYGEVGSILFSARNITSLKLAQMEKMAIEKQYIQAQKLEALGRLAGGVAHDFNNLITGINGYISLVRLEMDEDDPTVPMLIEIQGATERASDLTRQLMVFSKKHSTELQPTNINALIKNFHKVMSKMVGESIEIANKFEHDPWLVNADAGKIEQVLVNLIVNSADAMKEGGKIQITTKNVILADGQYQNVPGGRYLMFSVGDNGVGMDKELIEQVFEPLFTTKQDGKGSGLGLFTIYGIVKQHKGYIAIESSRGLGTVVKVFIPSAEGDNKMKIEVTSHDWPKGTETILIVEDEKLVRSVATRTLKRLGYNILEAEDGEDSISLIEKYNGQIDLLLTDVVMPGIGGLKLAGMVGKKYPNMKILFSSGYSEELIADQGILQKGINFLRKPYSPKLLANKVRDVFNS